MRKIPFDINVGARAPISSSFFDVICCLNFADARVDFFVYHNMRGMVWLLFYIVLMTSLWASCTLISLETSFSCLPVIIIMLLQLVKLFPSLCIFYLPAEFIVIPICICSLHLHAIHIVFWSALQATYTRRNHLPSKITWSTVTIGVEILDSICTRPPAIIVLRQGFVWFGYALFGLLDFLGEKGLNIDWTPHLL